jgi:hypothetical protein
MNEEQSVRGSIEPHSIVTTGERDTLLPRDETDAFRERWSEIQAGFVDDPRSSVERAQQLVANIVDELTTTFERERRNLESQWARGDTADTEALRVALQRYRAFFNLLLGGTQRNAEDSATPDLEANRRR